MLACRWTHVNYSNCINGRGNQYAQALRRWGTTYKWGCWYLISKRHKKISIRRTTLNFTCTTRYIIAFVATFIIPTKTRACRHVYLSHFITLSTLKRVIKCYNEWIGRDQILLQYKLLQRTKHITSELASTRKINLSNYCLHTPHPLTHPRRDIPLPAAGNQVKKVNS